MDSKVLKILVDFHGQLTEIIANFDSAKRLPPRKLLENATSSAAQAIAKEEQRTMVQRWHAETGRVVGMKPNAEGLVFLDMVHAGFVEDSPQGMETFLAWQGLGLAFLPAGEVFVAFRNACNASWAKRR